MPTSIAPASLLLEASILTKRSEAILFLGIIEYKEVALLTQKLIFPFNIRFSNEENPVLIECTCLS